MRQATRRYYTSGARAFVAAQADVVKEVMSNPALQKETEVAARNPDTKSLLTKCFDTLKAAAEVAGAIDKTGSGVVRIKQLGETFSNWLS
jgi:ATP-dependent RNA circularization protein (DNA/RNA ligase family)